MEPQIEALIHHVLLLVTWHTELSIDVVVIYPFIKVSVDFVKEIVGNDM